MFHCSSMLFVSLFFTVCLIVPIVDSSLSSDEPVTVSSSTSNMGETIISYMHSN